MDPYDNDNKTILYTAVVAKLPDFILNAIKLFETLGIYKYNIPPSLQNEFTLFVRVDIPWMLFAKHPDARIFGYIRDSFNRMSDWLTVWKAKEMEDGGAHQGITSRGLRLVLER